MAVVLSLRVASTQQLHPLQHRPALLFVTRLLAAPRVVPTTLNFLTVTCCFPAPAGYVKTDINGGDGDIGVEESARGMLAGGLVCMGGD